jgi:3-ketosteroid 9alpha-monooxygenase subunit B
MFHSLRVAEVIEETEEARSIVFEVPPQLAAAFTYRAGQFVTIEVDCGSERLRRCYSLASSPECGEAPKVTVKRVRGGRVSNWLNDHLRPGQVLPVMPPEGRFVLDAEAAPLLLFAAGSGITPVISIVKTALAKTARRATLVYANRDDRSVIFAAELARLQQDHPSRLRVVSRYDDREGLLDERAVTVLAAEHLDASCYLCGPAPFMDVVERALARTGFPPARVRIERFSASSSPSHAEPEPAQSAGEVPDFVDVELGGERHRVPYSAGKTLLQAARDAGLDAPYSCEEGFCGCCASDLLEGRVAMAADDALSDEEKRRGMILACQSRPLTKRCAFRFVDS